MLRPLHQTGSSLESTLQLVVPEGPGRDPARLQDLGSGNQCNEWTRSHLSLQEATLLLQMGIYATVSSASRLPMNDLQACSTRDHSWLVLKPGENLELKCFLAINTVC